MVDGFTEDTRSSSLFAREIMKLVHNVGYLAARYSLIGVPRADELLARLLSDDRAETVRSAYPGQTADRVTLLAGVDAYHHGDLSAARERAACFLESHARSGAQTAQEEGWDDLARVLADAIAARQGSAKGPAPAARHPVGARGLLQGLAPAVRDTLVSCTADVLPLLAALAVLHGDGPGGTPGDCCVPLCWQLHGGLAHLGFNGEVMAAAALIRRHGHDESEHVGQYRVRPC